MTSERYQPRGDVPEATRSRMSQQRNRDTEPELRLRRQLHAAGHRYRVQFPIPGVGRRSIDIAFTRQRVAVFIDGCFWHACPEHGTRPRVDASWWATKLRRNVERDRETDALLGALGWTVVRIWEHLPTDEAVKLVHTNVECRERAT